METVTGKHIVWIPAVQTKSWALCFSSVVLWCLCEDTELEMSGSLLS